MYSLLSQLKAMVVGPSINEQGSYEQSTTVSSTSNSVTTAQKQHRHFTGTVTSLNEESGAGMIDKTVFFEFDAVIGGLRPAVGVSVHVTASREHAHAGWRAERVEITSRWQPESKSEIEVVTGFVSRIGGGMWVIDCTTQEVVFSMDEVVSHRGYRPHVNDWVQVSLLHQDEETVINEIQPLRSRTLTGTVNSVSHGFGTVDSDIYFTFSSCCHGYRPRRGDIVSVECVEYKHQKSNWRAFKVEPVSSEEGEKTLSPHSPNRTPLPVVPLIGTGRHIQLSSITTTASAANIPIYPANGVTKPHYHYSSRNKSTINPRGDYHAKLTACRVPGQRPLRPRPLRLSHRLDVYPIPDYLRECAREEQNEDIVTVEPSLGEPLCMENYQDRFSTLLYLEEIQREIDIRLFDMCSVSLRQCGPFLSLSVPGLAEGRPSLLVGDKVIVCEEGGDDTYPHWEGYIHEVRSGDVCIKFADMFHETYNNQDVDVMFAFNRTPLRRMHHVVRMCHSIGPNMLFPGQPSPKPPLVTLNPIQGRPKGSTLNLEQKWFNPLLNSRQRAAVTRIIRAQCRPAPYVLFGPPGTGKTVTLVEAILQIHRLSPGSRILACTPSNSAADLLTERIHLSGQLKPGEMVRLNAIQRSQTPPTNIEPYCMDTDSADVAALSRVVIATCVTAGFLHSLGLAVGHFTHVFVDEAGQATEPECLLPISLLAETEGQIILAGDPCQLGPILSSDLVASYGLGLSLLERLMERPAYQRDETKFADHGSYDPLVVTKLVENYRSHVSLLQLYSQMFYHNELQPKAPPSLTHVLGVWEELPNKGFPLIFHGVQGEDMKEGNSPSWFNPVEALQVVKYVQALKDNSTFAPRLEDIGVVTPYRKQVEKLRLLLRKIGAEEVKVGSVEEFQGQERTAIIISTVRSTTELLDFDVHHHLGFLSNPKRFNVAISRAQALLVVVGNPYLLLQDPYWYKLVQYAVKNQAYVGCCLPELPS